MASIGYYFDEEVLASILMALTTGIPSGALGIASYILGSLALYTMAQRRQIRNAWLAWVPVLNCWILGSLSDQYRYVVKGQVRTMRKWLLGLNLASILLGLILSGRVIGIVFNILRYGDFAPSLLSSLVGSLGLLLPLAAVGIAITVLRYIALYDVYISVDPDNAVLFLVLSILIRIVEPFFLFFNREKDRGMPPRRDATQPTYSQENKDYL